MAERDRKRNSTTRSGGPGGNGRSTDDALERLFAEAMGSVKSARRTPKPAAPSNQEDASGLEFDVDIDDAFLDEQSIHYIIDDEESGTEQIVDGEVDVDDSDETPDEAEGADEEAGDDDIRRFIAESFGESALSDDDAELAFPDFGDDDEEEEEEEGTSPPGRLVADGLDAEVEFPIGRPAGAARRSTAEEAKTAPPAPTPEDTLRARISELGRRLEEREIELRSLRDRVHTLNSQVVAANRRGAAISREFETYRKRAERDREDHRKFAGEKILKEFLGVFDNLERALEHAGDESDGPLGQGVSMTLHQFDSALRQNGVERVDSALGATFDPVHHEAMGQAWSDDVPSGGIVGEMQAGFLLHGRLLRAALVTVSRGPESTSDAPDDKTVDGGADSQDESTPHEGEPPHPAGTADDAPTPAEDASKAADSGASEASEPTAAEDELEPTP